MDKKALSPLLATFLLIAFSITLGYILVDYLDNSPQLATKCSQNANIDIVYANNQKRICVDYNMSTLRFIIKNEGIRTIEGLRVTMVGQSVDTVTMNNIIIGGGAITSGEIDFDRNVGAIDQVEFRALYPDKEMNACPQTSTMISNIQECPWQ